MNTLLGSVVGILSVLFLWGAISPRSQWQVLVGWTRADPRDSEPGSSAYAGGRLLSLVGLAVILTLAASWAVGAIAIEQVERVRTPSVAERVWGEPRSYVVDRVFTPLQAPPEGLVEQAITGYQRANGAERSPSYLYAEGRIRAAGLATQPGFLGVAPLPGAVALETADVVVHVRGDSRCIPQQVVVMPLEGAVQLGVFFGPLMEGETSAEGSADADEPAGDASCDVSPAPEDSRGYLIPIDLTAPLGAREVQSLAGVPIPSVPLPSR